MPNSYFRFKQFSIQQERCSMKVCTDSCVFGAWTAGKIKGSRRILDVGTGTGLLTLMLAQKNQAQYDAIELDPEASGQATENISASPWSANIVLINADVRQYLFSHLYDFIIVNPPFFESDLHSPSAKKNKAKHEESLTLEELIFILRRLLNPRGAFSILLPFHRTGYFEKLASDNGMFLQEKLLIRQTPSHGPFRSVLLFASTAPDFVPVHELTIRDEEGKETAELGELLRDYYLR
jgi:tRNA1Val (adenine37-N6)-methyltransferase